MTFPNKPGYVVKKRGAAESTPPHHSNGHPDNQSRSESIPENSVKDLFALQSNSHLIPNERKREILRTKPNGPQFNNLNSLNRFHVTSPQLYGFLDSCQKSNFLFQDEPKHTGPEPQHEREKMESKFEIFLTERCQLNNEDFQKKVMEIKTSFFQELKKLDEIRLKYRANMQNLLNSQNLTRPVSKREIELKMKHIDDKFSELEMKLEEKVYKTILTMQVKMTPQATGKAKKKPFEKEERTFAQMVRNQRKANSSANARSFRRVRSWPQIN